MNLNGVMAVILHYYTECITVKSYNCVKAFAARRRDPDYLQRNCSPKNLVNSFQQYMIYL